MSRRSDGLEMQGAVGKAQHAASFAAPRPPPPIDVLGGRSQGSAIPVACRPTAPCAIHIWRSQCIQQGLS